MLAKTERDVIIFWNQEYKLINNIIIKIDKLCKKYGKNGQLILEDDLIYSDIELSQIAISLKHIASMAEKLSPLAHCVKYLTKDIMPWEALKILKALLENTLVSFKPVQKKLQNFLANELPEFKKDLEKIKQSIMRTFLSDKITLRGSIVIKNREKINNFFYGDIYDGFLKKVSNINDVDELDQINNSAGLAKIAVKLYNILKPKNDNFKKIGFNESSDKDGIWEITFVDDKKKRQTDHSLEHNIIKETQQNFCNLFRLPQNLVVIALNKNNCKVIEERITKIKTLNIALEDGKNGLNKSKVRSITKQIKEQKLSFLQYCKKYFNEIMLRYAYLERKMRTYRFEITTEINKQIKLIVKNTEKHNLTTKTKPKTSKRKNNSWIMYYKYKNILQLTKEAYVSFVAEQIGLVLSKYKSLDINSFNDKKVDDCYKFSVLYDILIICNMYHQADMLDENKSEIVTFLRVAIAHMCDNKEAKKIYVQLMQKSEKIWKDLIKDFIDLSNKTVNNFKKDFLEKNGIKELIKLLMSRKKKRITDENKRREVYTDEWTDKSKRNEKKIKEYIVFENELNDIDYEYKAIEKLLFNYKNANHKKVFIACELQFRFQKLCQLIKLFEKYMYNPALKAECGKKIKTEIHGFFKEIKKARGEVVHSVGRIRDTKFFKMIVNLNCKCAWFIANIKPAIIKYKNANVNVKGKIKGSTCPVVKINKRLRLSSFFNLSKEKSVKTLKEQIKNAAVKGCIFKSFKEVLKKFHKNVLKNKHSDKQKFNIIKNFYEKLFKYLYKDYVFKQPKLTHDSNMAKFIYLNCIGNISAQILSVIRIMEDVEKEKNYKGKLNSIIKYSKTAQDNIKSLLHNYEKEVSLLKLTTSKEIISIPDDLLSCNNNLVFLEILKRSLNNKEFSYYCKLMEKKHDLLVQEKGGRSPSLSILKFNN